MPPKPKYQREEMIAAGLALVREQGAERLTARDLAAWLQCSTRPIFTVFQNMDEFQQAVREAAWARYFAYRDAELKRGKYPPFKAMGMSYIRFAVEEKRLFQMLFMQECEAPSVVESEVLDAAMDAGVDPKKVKLFHLEIWGAVHGFATMLATGYYHLEEEQLSEMITDLFLGLKARHGGKQ